jgi:hypothetical protein
MFKVLEPSKESMGFLYRQIPKFLKIHSTDENDITHITGTLPGLENDVWV